MIMICNVPDEVVKSVRMGTWCGSSVAEKMIANGTPLPKGHGRLIILSENAVKRELTPLGFSCQYWISEVGLSDATLAIIEADKTEGEAKMNKKLADLKVNKLADYYENKVVKALENAGFVLVLDAETATERYYIVAESEVKNEGCC